MLTAAPFPTVRRRNQAKRPSPDEWMMKAGCIYTMKENEIVKFVGKWTELNKIVLREVTETQKDKRYTFPLICRPSSDSSDMSV